MLKRTSTSLLNYWQPRYWHVWVFYAWLRAVAPLPLRCKIALGKPTGRFLCALFRRKRRTIRRNLEACFPHLPANELKRLCTRHHESIGIGLTELASAWFGSQETVRQTVRIEGQEHLDAALSKGKGALLFCGHYTALELIHPVLKPLCPKLTAMYRPMDNELMDQIILRARLQYIDELFPKQSVKVLLKNLAGNAVVFYLADQNYRGKFSAPVPFFGLPAMTSTAVSRILKMSDATLLPLYFARLQHSAGYVATIGPPFAGLPSDDPVADTAIILQGVENHIRTYPEQYAWIHRRFKGGPAGYPDIYA